MKKLIVFSLLLFAGLSTSYAQTAKKSCSASKKSCAAKCAKKKAAQSSTSSAELNDPQVLKAALVAADQNENIEKKVCEKSGKVSFTKKSVCSKSGKVSYSDVAFEPATGAFVNVSPSEMRMDGEKMEMKEGKVKACCAGSKGKCCSSKAMKAEKAEMEVEKVEMKAAKAEMKVEKVQMKESAAKMKMKKTSLDN